GPPLGARALAGGRWRLGVGLRFLGPGESVGRAVPAAAPTLARPGADRAGSQQRQHLRAGNLGVPDEPGLLAAGVLVHLAAGLGRGAGPLRLDAGRVPVRGWLVGLPARRARPVVRPGGDRPGGVRGRPPAVRAALRGQPRLPARLAVRPAGLRALLLW